MDAADWAARGGGPFARPEPIVALTIRTHRGEEVHEGTDDRPYLRVSVDYAPASETFTIGRDGNAA